MANENRPRGLLPVGMVDGGPWDGQVRIRPVDATNPTALVPGARVRIGALGTVVECLPTESCVGVIAAVVVNRAAPQTEHPGYLPALTAGNVLVAEGTDIVFAIQEAPSGTPLTLAAIGRTINTNAAADDLVFGQARTQLNPASSTAACTGTLKIINIEPGAQNELGSGTVWLVRINLHQMNECEVSTPTVSIYSLGLGSGYAMMSGSTLTLTTFSSPSSIGGNIGEVTLAGVAPIFTYGSNLGSSGLTAALADVATLRATLSALPGTAVITPAALQSGNYGYGTGVFVPGVYTTAAAIGTTAATSMTLSGDGDYVFVSTGGAITFGATFNVVLTNGAKASRVFWVANNAITTGTTDNLKGNFMSGTAGAITIGSTNNIEGRLLSPVAVTVDGTASNIYLPLV